MFQVRREDDLKTLLWVWILVPLLALSALRSTNHTLISIEDRYMLPSYPALAMATAMAVDTMKNRGWINIFLFCACGWSIYLAFTYVYRFASDCIPFPL